MKHTQENVMTTSKLGIILRGRNSRNKGLHYYPLEQGEFMGQWYKLSQVRISRALPLNYITTAIPLCLHFPEEHLNHHYEHQQAYQVPPMKNKLTLSATQYILKVTTISNKIT